jgi:peptide/nickel transport system permease protein
LRDVLGVVSGYVRRLDGLLMRVTDALVAFHDILLAIALMAALGASLTDVVIALGTVYTPRIARVARGATLVLRELQFIEAAEALGASGRRVIVVHLLPNLASPLLVQGTFVFAFSILTEAALSFLGAGVPPTSPTWGNIIASAQKYMQNAAWLILAPGLCIVLTVVATGGGRRTARRTRSAAAPADMSVSPRLLEVEDLGTFSTPMAQLPVRWMASASRSGPARPWRSLENPAAASR